MKDNRDVKLQVLRDTLNNGKVKILVLSQDPGVVLPDYLKEYKTTTLSLSKRFKGSLRLEPDGIHAELSFKGTMHSVVIPWDALIAILDVTEAIHVFAKSDESVPQEEIQEAINGLMGRHLPIEKIERIDEPEVLLDKSKEFGLDVIPGGEMISPPRSGHLKLLN